MNNNRVLSVLVLLVVALILPMQGMASSQFSSNTINSPLFTAENDRGFRHLTSPRYYESLDYGAERVPARILVSKRADRSDERPMRADEETYDQCAEMQLGQFWQFVRFDKLDAAKVRTFSWIQTLRTEEPPVIHLIDARDMQYQTVSRGVYMGTDGLFHIVAVLDKVQQGDSDGGLTCATVGRRTIRDSVNPYWDADWFQNAYRESMKRYVAFQQNKQAPKRVTTDCHYQVKFLGEDATDATQLALEVTKFIKDAAGFGGCVHKPGKQFTVERAEVDDGGLTYREEIAYRLEIKRTYVRQSDSGKYKPVSAAYRLRES